MDTFLILSGTFALIGTILAIYVHFKLKDRISTHKKM